MMMCSPVPGLVRLSDTMTFPQFKNSAKRRIFRQINLKTGKVEAHANEMFLNKCFIKTSEFKLCTAILGIVL